MESISGSLEENSAPGHQAGEFYRGAWITRFMTYFVFVFERCHIQGGRSAEADRLWSCKETFRRGGHTQVFLSKYNVTRLSSTGFPPQCGVLWSLHVLKTSGNTTKMVSCQLSNDCTSVSSRNHHWSILSSDEGHLEAYMIFVADAADIVRGANIFMWSNFSPHVCMLCGGKLLHIKSNLAPRAFLLVTWSKIAPCDKQFYSKLCVSS